MYTTSLETSAQSGSDPSCCSTLNVLLAGQFVQVFQSIILNRFLLYVPLLSTMLCFQQVFFFLILHSCNYVWFSIHGWFFPCIWTFTSMLLFWMVLLPLFVGKSKRLDIVCRLLPMASNYPNVQLMENSFPMSPITVMFCLFIFFLI